ncbi:MAG: SH3 domain-containing protein [Treponema sp.]|nr:SH3 domain-containing protein [Treponema sp.]
MGYTYNYNKKKIVYALFLLSVIIGCTKTAGRDENEITAGDKIEEPAAADRQDEYNEESEITESGKIKKYYVNSYSGLYVRSGPSVSSNKIMLLSNNAEVVVIKRGESDSIDGIESFWFEINYNGTIGWVYGGYLSLETASERIIGNWWGGYGDTRDMYINHVFRADGDYSLGFLESEGALGTWKIKENILYVEPEEESEDGLDEWVLFSNKYHFEFIDNDTLKLLLIGNEDESWGVSTVYRTDDSFIPDLEG